VSTKGEQRQIELAPAPPELRLPPVEFPEHGSLNPLPRPTVPGPAPNFEGGVLPECGGWRTIRTLASDIRLEARGSIASEGDTVYWTEESSVRSLGLSGLRGLLRLAKDVVENRTTPGALVAEDGVLYWLEFGEGRLRTEMLDANAVVRWDADAGPRVLHAGAINSDVLLVASQRLYWVNHFTGEVWSIPVSGGRAELVASWTFEAKEVAPWFDTLAIEQVGDRLYWLAKERYWMGIDGRPIGERVALFSVGLGGERPRLENAFSSFVLSHGIRPVARVGSTLVAAFQEPRPPFVASVVGAHEAGPIAVTTFIVLHLLTSVEGGILGVGDWRDRRIIYVPFDGAPCELAKTGGPVEDMHVIGHQVVWLEQEPGNSEEATTARECIESALRAVELPASAREEE